MKSSYCEASIDRLRQSIQERYEQCQRECEDIQKKAQSQLEQCLAQSERDHSHYWACRQTVGDAQDVLVRRVRWIVAIFFVGISLLAFLMDPNYAYVLIAGPLLAVMMALGAGFVVRCLAYLPNAIRIRLRDRHNLRTLGNAYADMCEEIQRSAEGQCEELTRACEAYARETRQQIDQFKTVYLEQIKASRKRLASSRHLWLLSQEVLKVFTECAKCLKQPGECMQLELEVKMDSLSINRIGKVKRQPLYQKRYYDLDLEDLPDPAHASALCILLHRSAELELRMNDNVAIRTGVQDDGRISLQLCR